MNCEIDTVDFTIPVNVLKLNSSTVMGTNFLPPILSFAWFLVLHVPCSTSIEF